MVIIMEKKNNDGKKYPKTNYQFPVIAFFFLHFYFFFNRPRSGSDYEIDTYIYLSTTILYIIL